jgi:hypothetical protein
MTNIVDFELRKFCIEKAIQNHNSGTHEFYIIETADIFEHYITQGKNPLVNPIPSINKKGSTLFCVDLY